MKLQIPFCSTGVRLALVLAALVWVDGQSMIFAEDASRAVSGPRASQAQELDALRAEYDAMARQPGVDKAKLLAEYNAKANAIKSRHLAGDTRAAEVADIKERYQGQIDNTGSNPKDVRADVDLAAQNEAAGQRLAEEWRGQGDVVTETPTKYVNQTRDATLWKPETPEITKAKVDDLDAYSTEGGQAGTGNRGRATDELGWQTDSEKKFIHSQQEGDIKTTSKSVDKAASATGTKRFDPNAQTMVVDPETGKMVPSERVKGGFVRDEGIKANNPEFYEQAETMRRYGDDAQAGVTELGDTPEVRQQKLDKWNQDAAAEMAKAREIAERRSAVRDQVRQNLQESLENATPADPANQAANARDAAEIDGQRTRVRESNAAAEGKNAELRQELEASRTGKGSKPPVDADNVTAGDTTPSTTESGRTGQGAGETSSGAAPDGTDGARLGEGPKTEVGRTSSGAAPDGTDGARLGEGPKTEVSRTSSGAAPDGTDGARLGEGPKTQIADAPDSTGGTSQPGGPKGEGAPSVGTQVRRVLNTANEVMGGVTIAGQFGEAGTRQAGNAIDQNRDFTAGDAGQAVLDGSGIPSMYQMGHDISKEEQLRVERGEQGQAAALGRTTLRMGDRMARDLINDPVDRAIAEEEARAAAAGEEPSYVNSSYNAATDIGGKLTGIGALANAVEETTTWDARADAAAQQATMSQFIDNNIARGTKNIRTLQSELEDLSTRGDVNNPDTAAQIQQRLNQMDAEYQRLNQLNEMTRRNFGDDPDKVKNVNLQVTTLPDKDSVRDYVNQMVTDRGGSLDGGNKPPRDGRSETEVTDTGEGGEPEQPAGEGAGEPEQPGRGESGTGRGETADNPPQTGGESETPPASEGETAETQPATTESVGQPPDAGSAEGGFDEIASGEPESEPPSSSDEQRSPGGWTADQLQHDNYAMGNLAQDVQGRIDNLQQQIDESHNSTERRDLRNQIEQQQQELDNLRNRVDDNNNELTAMGAATGTGDGEEVIPSRTGPGEDTEIESSPESGDAAANAGSEVFDSGTGKDEEDQTALEETSTPAEGENEQTPSGEEEIAEEAAPGSEGDLAASEPGYEESGGQSSEETNPDTEGGIQQFATLTDDRFHGDTGTDLDLIQAASDQHEAETASDQQVEDAENTRDQGGADAQDTLNETAGEVAQGDSENSWGNVMGDSVADGLANGGQQAGQALGGAGADQVAGEVFGPTPGDSSSGSSESGDAEGGNEGEDAGPGVDVASATNPQGTQGSAPGNQSGNDPGNEPGSEPAGNPPSQPQTSPPQQPSEPASQPAETGGGMCPNCHIPKIKCSDGVWRCPNSGWVKQNASSAQSTPATAQPVPNPTYGPLFGPAK